MRFLLTSHGISSQAIAMEFSRLVKKRFTAVKVMFVPTACRSKEELAYVEHAKEELQSLGIKQIKVVNFDHTLTAEEMDWFDVMYVCGGNTFYLLQQARKSNVEAVLRKFLMQGGLYVGVSAGSILVGPTAEQAVGHDQNDVGLKDLKGLHLTDAVVYPHYDNSQKNSVEELQKKLNHQVYAITDTQALLVEELEKIVI